LIISILISIIVSITVSITAVWHIVGSDRGHTLGSRAEGVTADEALSALRVGVTKSLLCLDTPDEWIRCRTELHLTAGATALRMTTLSTILTFLVWVAGVGTFLVGAVSVLVVGGTYWGSFFRGLWDWFFIKTIKAAHSSTHLLAAFLTRVTLVIILALVLWNNGRALWLETTVVWAVSAVGWDISRHTSPSTALVRTADHIWSTLVARVTLLLVGLVTDDLGIKSRALLGFEPRTPTLVLTARPSVGVLSARGAFYGRGDQALSVRVEVWARGRLETAFLSAGVLAALGGPLALVVSTAHDSRGILAHRHTVDERPVHRLALSRLH